MALEDLTERERQVFLSIVHSFIQTAEPVGSRYLAKHYNLNISPATIRNVMTDLEERGLITQPHTSAGRVPTDTGYRQYVESLRGVVKLSSSEKRSIVEQLKRFTEDLDLIIEKSTEVLSKISSQLGVVLAPRFNEGKLRKIDLIPLTNNKLLMVISVQSGLVKTVIVEIEQEIPSGLLEATTQIINERIHDVSIKDLQTLFDERFRDLDLKKKRLLNALKSKTQNILQYETNFHFAGAKNVISQPEFETKEKVSKILELLDRKDVLVRVMSEHESDGVTIVIGEENKEDLMKNCSLITTTYHLNDASGTIGVIGPTRMQYAKIIALVEFMAETLSCLVSKS